MLERFSIDPAQNPTPCRFDIFARTVSVGTPGAAAASDEKCRPWVTSRRSPSSGRLPLCVGSERLWVHAL